MVINLYRLKNQGSVFVTLCLCVAALFFSSALGQAQTLIEIPEDSNWSRTLINELEVMSDEQREWSSESLFATSSDLFEPNSLNEKPVLNNYWAKFSLVNTSESEQWLSFESYYWDFVTLYFRDSTGNVSKIPFGILSDPNIHKFLVKPQTEYDVLANFESSGQFRRDDNLNLVIKSTIPALEIKTLTSYLDGITFGIMFSLALYNLFLFIKLRDKTYFWYALYIFSFAFSFLTLFSSAPSKWTQFFTPDYPLLAFYIKKIADPIAWIAYINFVRYFLATKSRHPIWDKVLKMCIGLIILQFLINLSGVYRFSGVSRSLSWNLPVAICVLLAIYSYFKGYTKAKFFIVGQIFLVIGIIITTMFYAGLDVLFFLPKTDFFNHFRTPSSIFVFGAIESIVFSFALADKYNILQKDITRVKIEKEKDKSEAIRLQELDTFKTRFYSNITHEFRTPLTIILGMTETLKTNVLNKRFEGAEKSLEMISRNGKTLLELVNELLDLAKVESGSMELNVVQTDVIPYIKYMSESFHSLTEAKNIKLAIYSEIESLQMDVDLNKLASITSNLLSNAIKFTEPNGKIFVHLNKTQSVNIDHLVIKVQDNGIGLAEDDINQLFDRFYQVENKYSLEGEGTGIGLSLTKEFVELLNGTISVKSVKGKGSTFTVQLPVTNDANKTVDNDKAISNITPIEKNVSILIKESSELNQISTLPLALIIEDNEDVVHYLITCLKGKYQTIHAINGNIGIEIAQEKMPDIIISDVMMPEKDGFEVCATLKADELTDHIPIILLTAKVTTEDRLAGLSHGADAYLAKPFNEKELFIRLDQLVMLRKKLIDKIKKDGFSKFFDKQPLSPETKFLQKVIQIINEDISNSSFGSSDLANKLHLSESQTYRKLKAITNKSTAVFIRSIRLQSAKELIKTTDKTISEIAYETGFNDPSWFSRAFKEEFGFAPSEASK